MPSARALPHRREEPHPGLLGLGCTTAAGLAPAACCIGESWVQGLGLAPDLGGLPTGWLIRFFGHALRRSASDFKTGETIRLQQAGALLGSGELFDRVPHSQFELHVAIVKGAFPYAALDFLVSGVKTLTATDIANVLGVSLRALRRQ